MVFMPGKSLIIRDSQTSFFQLVVVFVYAVLLTSCTSAPYYDQKNPSVKISEIRVDLSDTQKVKQILNQQYKDWRYVQHRMGVRPKKVLTVLGWFIKPIDQSLGLICLDLPIINQRLVEQ